MPRYWTVEAPPELDLEERREWYEALALNRVSAEPDDEDTDLAYAE